MPYQQKKLPSKEKLQQQQRALRPKYSYSNINTNCTKKNKQTNTKRIAHLLWKDWSYIHVKYLRRIAHAHTHTYKSTSTKEENKTIQVRKKFMVNSTIKIQTAFNRSAREAKRRTKHELQVIKWNVNEEEGKLIESYWKLLYIHMHVCVCMYESILTYVWNYSICARI